MDSYSVDEQHKDFFVFFYEWFEQIFTMFVFQHKIEQLGNVGAPNILEIIHIF